MTQKTPTVSLAARRRGKVTSNDDPISMHITAISRRPLSLNVRGFPGLAADLVSAVTTATPRDDTHDAVADFMNRNLPDHLNGEVTADPPDTSRERAEITSDELLGALESTGWNRTQAAEVLKISRATFWGRLKESLDIRRVADIALPDLRHQKDACGGNLELLAKKIGASVTLVISRLGPHR